MSAVDIDGAVGLPANDPHNAYPEYVQNIIETLNEELHPFDEDDPTTGRSPANLEAILDMIRVNLTFDDPGIYFSWPTAHPRARQMQLEFNVWLHHQLVYIVSRFPSDALRRKAAELQFEMLSAALLKQRWLFRHIVARYADLLRGLSQDVDWTRLPYVVWPNTDDDDESAVSIDAPNRSRIEVPSFALRDTLAINCVALLAHCEALFVNADADLLRTVAEAVGRAFVALGLAGKTHCLRFFAKLLRRKIVAGDSTTGSVFHRIVPMLLQGIQQIYHNVPMWLQFECGVRPKDCQRFAMSVVYLLGIRELPAYCTADFGYACCRELCTAVLQQAASGDDEGDEAVFDGQFAAAVLEFFGKVLRLNAVSFGRDLSALVRREQRRRLDTDLLVLLQTSVRDRLCGRANGDRAVFDLIDQLVEFAFEVEDAAESLLIDKFRLINTLSTMLLSAEHEFQQWHQDEHLQHTSDDFHRSCSTCCSPELIDGDLERMHFFHFAHQLRQTHQPLRTRLVSLAQRFLRLVRDKVECVSSAPGLFELAECAWRLFGNRHSRSLDEQSQAQLFALAMPTISPNTAVLVRHFPALQIIAKHVRPSEALREHLERILVTIQSSDLHGLSKALRAELVQLFAGPVRFERNAMHPLWQHFLLRAELSLNELLDAAVGKLTPTDESNAQLMAQLVRVLVCAAGGRTYSVSCNESMATQLCCLSCCPLDELPQGLLHRNRFNEWSNTGAMKNVLRQWLPVMFGSGEMQTRLDATECLAAISVHFVDELVRSADAWLSICLETVNVVQMSFVAVVPVVLDNVVQKSALSANERRAFFARLFDNISRAVEASLRGDRSKAGGAQLQSGVVGLLRAVATHRSASELTVLQTILLGLVFMVRVESSAAKTAALCIFEICARFGTTVRRMVAWHRERIFRLLVAAAVANFLQHGIGLHVTLSNFCQLLGYQHMNSTFIPHYSATIVALLLPWRMRHAECEPLLEELCSAQNKSRQHVLSSAFLHAYTFVALKEPPELRARCVQYMLRHSGRPLVGHLKADSQRTLNEILVWYHRDPEFVMQTLRQLLGPPEAAAAASATPQQPLSAIAEYIASRFLGVLNYFDVVLVANDLEKSLQAEMLQSLGEIIRLMGAEHITPFRFKILTVLRSVLAIDNRRQLRDICASVWKIFVYTVDVQSMGPLLSIVVVFLESLMDTHPDVVNDMLKYLIISNGNLLSMYINDLFFIERTRASAEVKAFVQRHARDANNGFDSRFRLLAKQIGHENIDVRVHALQFLTNLFAAERRALNALVVLGQPSSNPAVEELFGSLLEGTRHADVQLQLAAGRCFGRIGALEPSHLPPNYAPQRRFALGIHTDVFATMALAELCRAYQFQKDTKLVDGFSLAIQEILLARGVCPEKKMKLNVWNAIPERMRQLMTPLLSSCYAALPTNQTHTAHPIFSTGRFSTAQAWACAWTTRLTEYVRDEHTRHLLKSFRTSLRNDTGVLNAFLPYIVLHAVQTCSDAHGVEIEEELKCVFARVSECSADALAVKCARIAFNQLEFLGAWLRQYHSVFAGRTADEEYGRIVRLLQTFDARQLAVANFRCGEHARALQYLEVYVEERRADRLQGELSFLAQIYAELVDTDSLEGALNMKSQKPTLDEQVLLHNATGRLQESTVCFEQMMQQGGLTEANAVDMVQCYLGLDQPETALMVSDALMKQMYERQMPTSMYACGAEALWRLGRFDELDDVLMTTKSRAEAPDWGIRCGELLLAMRRGKEADFRTEIDRCQLSVLKVLQSHDGDEQGSYDKVYPLLLRLHQIAEIDMCQSTIENVVRDSGGALDVMKNLFAEWDARLELLQPSAKILEPVLCLRRTLLTEAKSLIGERLGNGAAAMATKCAEVINTYIGSSLIRSTELSRSAEMYQQSQLFILNAEAFSPPTLFIERAKLFWSKNDQASSLSTLERGIEEIRLFLADNKTSKNDDAKKVQAEAKFLVAVYNAESMNKNTTLNIKYFKDALQASGDSEKCYVYYAQYLERVFAALSNGEQLGGRGNDMQQEIMTCYGKSMSCGCRFIFQSMPRFLSIWLDFTARTPTDTSDSYRKVSQNMTKIVDHFAENLPSFVFFTAFSQLVSRICHPSAEVYLGLKTIIIKLIKSFTQQSMWMLMSVYKSSYASRVKRCTEILSDRRLAGRDIQKLINDFNLLAERMIELTNRPVNTGEKVTIATVYKELPALLRSPGFSRIILPINKYMLPVLPAADQRNRSASEFNAFPNQAIYIEGCQDELIVLPSLQKPKRITLIGNDGRDYMIMMKPKDDLRKDFRLMEFNAIVNRYLRQDAEARHRRLNIRTYAVLPLNEECGIIEWLCNLQALRPIVMELLKRKSMGVQPRELRELYRKARDLEAKRAMLVNELIPRHPPQLAEWYKERFSTAHNWYLARSSFVRTTAVISFVGYILGLGDRHGENILMDTSNGDTVHVDFNCLFNKGESFEVPELVPFRLTHNMVNAMGPLGVEGAYRKCSQITMRVLREQKATLMSVLRPFAYDPLVSWNRVMSKSDGRQERTDTQAITNVKRIEERLQGYVKMNGVIGTMALSYEGVVNHCIGEATDLDKLAAMYVGWGPFV